MTNQVIPAQAVEAAAKVIFDRHHTRYAWASVGDEFKDVWRQDATAALEAAAPHMPVRRHFEDPNLHADLMAIAWDEGYTIGNAHNGRRDANPYRPTK